MDLHQRRRNWAWSSSLERAEKPESGGAEGLTSANFTSGLQSGVTYEVRFDYGFTLDTTPSNSLQILIRTASGGVTGSGLSGSGTNAGTLGEICVWGEEEGGRIAPRNNVGHAFIVFRGNNANANDNGSILWVDNVFVQRKVPEIDAAQAAMPAALVGMLLSLFSGRRRHSG